MKLINMEPNKRNKRFQKSNLDADIAGVSAGTFLLLLTQQLNLGEDLTNFFIYISPTVSIGLSIFWRWGKKRLDDNFKLYMFRRFVKKAKDFILKSLKDETLSNERKEELKILYDEINKKAEKIHFNRLDSIKFEEDTEIPFDEE